MVALPLGGYLCVNGFAGGWPSIFYVFGCVGIFWFCLWMVLVSKSPEEHRFISQHEKEYIIEQTKEGLSGKKEVDFLFLKRDVKSYFKIFCFFFRRLLSRSRTYCLRNRFTVYSLLTLHPTSASTCFSLSFLRT